MIRSAANIAGVAHQKSKLYKDQNCVQAVAEFGRARLVELLNSVRNRILDFAIAVAKEAPAAGEPDGTTTSPTIESTRVTQIFNTTIYGGAANIVGAPRVPPSRLILVQTTLPA